MVSKYVGDGKNKMGCSCLNLRAALIFLRLIYGLFENTDSLDVALNASVALVAAVCNDVV